MVVDLARRRPEVGTPPDLALSLSRRFRARSVPDWRENRGKQRSLRGTDEVRELPVELGIRPLTSDVEHPKFRPIPSEEREVTGSTPVPTTGSRLEGAPHLRPVMPEPLGPRHRLLTARPYRVNTAQVNGIDPATHGRPRCSVEPVTWRPRRIADGITVRVEPTTESAIPTRWPAVAVTRVSGEEQGVGPISSILATIFGLRIVRVARQRWIRAGQRHRRMMPGGREPTSGWVST